MPQIDIIPKRSLLLTAIALGAVALGIAVFPFVASLGVTEKAKNEAWGKFDLSDMRPGETRAIGRAAAYRRAEADKKSIDAFEALLFDPNSDQSAQPANAKNKWRSSNPDFFIYLPWAPKRLCGIEFIEPLRKIHPAPSFPEFVVLKSMPHFVEPCNARFFDQSGRVLSRSGWPEEGNLIVPDTVWVSDKEVLVFGP